MTPATAALLSPSVVSAALARSLRASSRFRGAEVALTGLVSLAIAGLWWAPEAVSRAPLWQVAALTMGLGWCAAAEAARRRHGRGVTVWMPSLLLTTGICLIVASLVLPAGLTLSRFSDVAWIGLGVALPLALAGYPQARPVTRADRLAAALLLVLGLAGVDPAGLFRSPSLDTGSLRGVLGCASAGVLLTAWWWRGEHAGVETRVALLWPALGTLGGGLLIGHLLFTAEAISLSETLVVVAALILVLLAPASVAVGLLAPGVYDVRRLISGFAVSVVMVDLTVGMMAGSLAGFAILTGAPANKGVAAVVATAYAVAFGPVRLRVRRTIEEVLFGGSSDPLDAMSRLGARLGADSAPDAWAEALRSALVVPRVELRIGGAVLAAAGSGSGVTRVTALLAGGEHVGDLVVTLPSDATRLPRSTRAVLDLVAAPLARALQAVGLADELHASRGRVVQAREEERRRLRRDLHDGLGPLLTGVAYTADAAANVLLSDTGRATTLLAQLRQDTTDAIAEIRRIVQGLRPPALDDVGLAGALRQHVIRYDGAVRVEVGCTLDAADAPGRLPAAVEVVAYRVAVEALTNAVRHARPRAEQGILRVTVEIGSAEQDRLVITVQDDGTPPGPWTTGTGLASILARCDEVGGTAVAGPTAAGGRVEARLPLRPA